MQKIKNIIHPHHTNQTNTKDNTHHTLGGLLHRHKDTETVSVSEPILSQAVPAVELVQRRDVHDELLLKKEEVLVPVDVKTVEVVEPAVATTTLVEPLNVKHVEKDVVVHEHIHPVEKEEIQPIIYREREQMEVKQVTERLHETEIQPTLVEKRDLAPEVREVVVEKAAPIPENVVLPSLEVDATLRSVETHAPIVNEVIKKTVIEEVQPVLEKDVVVPTLIQETKCIYEKIVEAPVLIREELPVREITKEKVIVQSEMMKGKATPLAL
ncbi:Pf11-1 protein [Planoprotostelium fungivorum]|uniref:Pf11-1 protein n=1 Tax=Planoprotostelium fungivorum TaxID=1890364 RepID=A0A2P6NT46_9EUKA|nr:Pf11-1 protein [Planoprotostelium fungivorum]